MSTATDTERERLNAEVGLAREIARQIVTSSCSSPAFLEWLDVLRTFGRLAHPFPIDVSSRVGPRTWEAFPSRLPAARCTASTVTTRGIDVPIYTVVMRQNQAKNSEWAGLARGGHDVWQFWSQIGATGRSDYVGILVDGVFRFYPTTPLAMLDAIRSHAKSRS